MRTMVIDDYPEVREVVRFYLGKFNLELIECGSGNEAIQIISQGEEFDLIISDYNMPDGDGLSVLKYLYTSGSKTKFLLFTSATGLSLDSPYENFLGIFPKNDLNCGYESN